jgi:hypothetical protein
MYAIARLSMLSFGSLHFYCSSFRTAMDHGALFVPVDSLPGTLSVGRLRTRGGGIASMAGGGGLVPSGGRRRAVSSGDVCSLKEILLIGARTRPLASLRNHVLVVVHEMVAYLAREACKLLSSGSMPLRLFYLDYADLHSCSMSMYSVDTSALLYLVDGTVLCAARNSAESAQRCRRWGKVTPACACRQRLSVNAPQHPAHRKRRSPLPALPRRRAAVNSKFTRRHAHRQLMRESAIPRLIRVPPAAGMSAAVCIRPPGRGPGRAPVCLRPPPPCHAQIRGAAPPGQPAACEPQRRRAAAPPRRRAAAQAGRDRAPAPTASQTALVSSPHGRRRRR